MFGQDLLDRIAVQRFRLKEMRMKLSQLKDPRVKRNVEDSLNIVEVDLDEQEAEVKRLLGHGSMN